jgi:putative cardiolipin synthase
MILDKQKVFIGSFNFDPRSVFWNTEVGVLVDSPELAGQVRQLALEGMAPAMSYHGKPRTTVASILCARSPAANGADSRPGSATRSAWRKCSRSKPGVQSLASRPWRHCFTTHA